MFVGKVIVLLGLALVAVYAGPTTYSSSTATTPQSSATTTPSTAGSTATTTPSTAGSTATTTPSTAGSTATTTPSTAGSTATTTPSTAGSTATTTPSTAGSTATTTPSTAGSTATTTPSTAGSTATTTPSTPETTATTTPSTAGSTATTTPSTPETTATTTPSTPETTATTTPSTPETTATTTPSTPETTATTTSPTEETTATTTPSTPETTVTTPASTTTVDPRSDLEKGLLIMACARRAMAVGVPELGIPPHDPYVVIKHNFTFDADIGSFLGAKINISQMTWAGLAHWRLTATQLNLDSEKSAAFHFKLYWDYLKIAGHFDSVQDAIIFHPKQHGTFSIEFEETDWKGNLNVTKPNAVSNGTVNHSDIHWHAEDVKVKLTGLGLLNRPTASIIGSGLKNALNKNLLRNAIGDFIKMRLETVWWNTGKVWELTKWCQENPDFSDDMDLVY